MDRDWLPWIVWLLVLAVLLAPLVQRRLLRLRREGGLQRLGRARGSRALALIHHRETYRLLGLPLLRQEERADAERVLRAIARTPGDVPIDLVLHTAGGDGLPAEQLAHALVRHPARVTVFVPHYALGGGTLIALAADEIVLDPNAVLGPVDPRVGPYPAASLLALLQEKGGAQLDDRTLVLVDQARKARAQTQALVAELLAANETTSAHAGEIAAALTGGGWTPRYPLMIEEAQRLGLPVNANLPPDLYALMDLYDTGMQPRPSVSLVTLEEA